MTQHVPRLYVIVRDDGAFVSQGGYKHSYTRHLENARTFASRESAESSLAALDARQALATYHKE